MFDIRSFHFLDEMIIPNFFVCAFNQTMKRTLPFLLANEAFLYLFVSMYEN